MPSRRSPAPPERYWRRRHGRPSACCVRDTGGGRPLFLSGLGKPQGGGTPLKNTWIGAAMRCKSLIGEANSPTSSAPFSTSRLFVSTCRAIYSTSRLFGGWPLYLSLLLVNKEREESRQGVAASTGWKRCLFFNPHVFPVIHGSLVDCVDGWSLAVQGSLTFSGGYPRIHRFFCAPLPENR